MELVTPSRASLLTDFYELTMSASYFARDMDRPATFELFTRRLPRNRNFVLAAGTEKEDIHGRGSDRGLCNLQKGLT